MSVGAIAATPKEEPPPMAEALKRYGPEILGFLVVMLRDPVAGRDVYAQFCEDFWRGYPSFRGDSSLRTWAYVLARHAAVRWAHAQPRPTLVPLSQTPELAAPQPSAPAPHQRSTIKAQLDRIRARLHPDDQALLTLRIDRGLPWSDVARIFLEEGEEIDDAALARKAAALRKRFERLKDELKAALEAGV
jgi:RNA polymerase sigma-70 factor (ECF subfamily)